MLKPTKTLAPCASNSKPRAFNSSCFSDMHGVSKTKMVPLAHLNDMVAGSELRTADNEDELQHLKCRRLVEIPSYWGHMSCAGQNAADTEFIDGQLKELLAASVPD
jgi:hypothetical protein